jgi:hypothetical protein
MGNRTGPGHPNENQESNSLKSVIFGYARPAVLVEGMAINRCECPVNPGGANACASDAQKAVLRGNLLRA